MKKDLYTDITNKIIKSMETAGSDWLCQWSKEGTSHFNAKGKGYRGINQILLWISCFENGYKSRNWMTYKQAVELGGNVRKGEKSTLIILNKPATIEDKTTGEDKDIWVFRGYCVFNVEQIENLPAKFYEKPQQKNAIDLGEFNAFDEVVKQSGAMVQHGGDRAFYVPSADFIQMPDLWRWKNADDYRATLAHELTHWTGHKSRLNRDMNTRFHTNAYAFEELVAELGAAFLCGQTGISNEPRKDHAKYLNSWIEVLRKDKKAIFSAASLAQKATDFLLNYEYVQEKMAAE